MITFDLSCDRNHRFEGWFRDRDDFDRQLADGLLVCPVCGSARVEKRLSAVAVHVGRRSAPSAPPPQPPAVPAGPSASPAPMSPPPQAFFHALAEFVEKNFEDVGPKFADEARKIDSGECEARNIRGTTTPEEEAGLQEDGVEFLKLALPKYDA
jgi:hypothetical protein